MEPETKDQEDRHHHHNDCEQPNSHKLIPLPDYDTLPGKLDLDTCPSDTSSKGIPKMRLAGIIVRSSAPEFRHLAMSQGTLMSGWPQKTYIWERSCRIGQVPADRLFGSAFGCLSFIAR
jgi:hypothetical protein